MGRGLELRRLQFNGAMEAAFREEYYQNSRVQVRFISLLALVLVTVIGALEVTLPPEQRARIWAIRFGLYTPAILVSLLLTFTPWYRRLMQWLMAFTVLLVGGSTLYMSVLHTRFETGIFQFNPLPICIVILAGYTLSKLRFLAATAVAWTLIALYLFAAYSLGFDRLSNGTEDTINLLVANLIGMCAAYATERYLRRDFLLTRMVEAEREKSERLLLNILPGPVADRLKQESATIADHFAEVTVLFADIVDFTTHSTQVAPTALVDLLNAVFSCFDSLAETHGLEKIKTIGDAYMVVGGLPEPQADHAHAIAAMALAMQTEIARFRMATGQPFRLRIGIHSGPVVAGVIGIKKFIYDLWGDTVNMASRMELHGVPGAIQVTEATYERLRDTYRFEARGAIPVKGRGDVATYLLLGPKSAPGQEGAAP